MQVDHTAAVREKAGVGGSEGTGVAQAVDRSHQPKHVRASYEREIDKVSMGMRTMGNVQKENQHAAWMQARR
jgi:hypothetical protein